MTTQPNPISRPLELTSLSKSHPPSILLLTTIRTPSSFANPQIMSNRSHSVSGGATEWLIAIRCSTEAQRQSTLLFLATPTISCCLSKVLTGPTLLPAQISISSFLSSSTTTAINQPSTPRSKSRMIYCRSLCQISLNTSSSSSNFEVVVSNQIADPNPSSFLSSLQSNGTIMPHFSAVSKKRRVQNFLTS